MTRPEDNYVKEIIAKLESVGWVNGASKYLFKYKEHEVLPEYLIESILKDRVRKINENLLTPLSFNDSEMVINKAINELKVNSIEYVLDYLKYGIQVSTALKSSKNLPGRIKLINYDNINENIFFYLKYPRFMGLSEREPDLLLYVNGIPLVIIEVKDRMKINSYKEGIKQIRTYEREIPELFKYVQIGVVLGDDEYYTPTLPAAYNVPKPSYKWNVERTYISDVIQLLRPETLLRFLKYFVYFRETRGSGSNIEKIVARYNQYYAANEILKRAEEYLNNKDDRNKGLIWHWQGSGKTYIMYFAASMFIDKFFAKRPIVFIIVDRRELEDQVQKMLNAIKDTFFKNMLERIESIKDLHNTLRRIKESEWNQNIIPTPTIYLVTIQKFAKSSEGQEGIDSLLKSLGEEYLEELKKRNYEEYAKIIAQLDKLNQKSKEEEIMNLGSIKKKEVLVLIDEAHRSQYGILASMMRRALPNALIIGFTGTPVLKYDRNTLREFAYPERNELYLHVYSISDSIKDGFTIPIIYRVVTEGDINSSSGLKINLSKEEIQKLVNECEKQLEDENVEDCEELIQTTSVTKTILSNPKRIEAIAKYIVDHLEEDLGCDPRDYRNCPFKAMVVAVNRISCVRYKNALDQYLVKKYGEEAKDWVEVVMTYQVNDENDIVRYRNKLTEKFSTKNMEEINRKIVDKFKEEAKPRIVVVTDMLLTGFDAPNLKVMYLDKPLFGHRLLQAIARVNRPFKVNEEEIKGQGMIVDFIGLIRYLVHSMSIYEMLAKENPQEVKKDFKGEAINSIENEFNKFIEALNDIKRKLKKLRLGFEEINIDVDELADLLKKNQKSEVFKRLQDDAVELASYAEDLYYEEYKEYTNEAKKLLNELSKVIRMYRSLGAYPEKLKYENEVKVLSMLYGRILVNMNKTVKPDISYIRDKLLEYIYDNTIVKDLVEIGRVEISGQVFELIDSLTDKQKSKSMSPREIRTNIEEVMISLKNELSSRPRDPIYNKLYEKLINVIQEWSLRKIEALDTVKKLKEIFADLESYRETVKEKPISEVIAYALSTYISEKYLNSKQVMLEFKNTRETIDKIVESIRSKNVQLLPEDIKQIKAKILTDILTELRNTIGSDTKSRISNELDQIVEEIVRPYIESYSKKEVNEND